MRSLNDPLSRRLWIARKQAELLSDSPEWMAQVQRVEKLADAGPATARQLVEVLLEFIAADEKAGRAARQTYLAGGTGKRQDLYSELVRVTLLALESLGGHARDALLEAFDATPPGSAARGWLLLALENLEDPLLADFFRRLTEDPDLAEQAQRALARLEALPEASTQGVTDRAILGHQKALQEFIAGTKSSNYLTRWRAAEALGDLGDRSALPALQALLADEHLGVREAAHTAIRRLQDT